MNRQYSVVKIKYVNMNITSKNRTFIIMEESGVERRTNP